MTVAHLSARRVTALRRPVLTSFVPQRTSFGAAGMVPAAHLHEPTMIHPRCEMAGTYALPGGTPSFGLLEECCA
ncbi:hypothetical protein GCM10008941_18880 [Rhizomicrobium palustre]